MKTKIIATLGPASNEEYIIRELVKLGVSGFRINFSHGDSRQWFDFVKIIREIEEQLDRKLALIGDLQGPNIRIGKIYNEILNIEQGKEYIFINYTFSEKNDEIPVPIVEFFESAEVGDIIQIGDSMLPFKVVKVDKSNSSYLIGIALENGAIKSRMAINIKGKDLPIPYISSKDIEDTEFAISNRFSHIMVSFVRFAEDIESVKKILQSRGGEEIKVLAKLETSKAIENLSTIAKASDGLVIARGDLGKVFPLEHLPKLQEEIIRTSLQLSKPVYVATQLLTSMVDNPIPTRSEITDIYVSVKEGVDGIILTNETSIGKYPKKSVEWARKVIEEAEKGVIIDVVPQIDDLSWKLGRGIVYINDILDSTLLIFSLTGKAMRIVSSYRPKKPFFTGSPNTNVLRDCSILYGCLPVDIDSYDYDDGLEKLKNKLKNMGLLKPGTLTVSSYKFSNIDKQKILIEKL